MVVERIPRPKPDACPCLVVDYFGPCEHCGNYFPPRPFLVRKLNETLALAESRPTLELRLLRDPKWRKRRFYHIVRFRTALVVRFLYRLFVKTNQ